MSVSRIYTWHVFCYPHCDLSGTTQAWIKPDLRSHVFMERIMAVADVLKMIKDNGVKFVDLRFTDT